MEYWKRYSSWPVRTLKSCLEALENPVLEVPARHGSRGSNSSFRAPSSRPPPAASTLWYPPFATLNRCHQSTELPHLFLPRLSSSFLSPPLSLHASMTILWTSATKFRLPISHTLLLRSHTHLSSYSPVLSCHGTHFGHLRRRLLP